MFQEGLGKSNVIKLGNSSIIKLKEKSFHRFNRSLCSMAIPELRNLAFFKIFSSIGASICRSIGKTTSFLQNFSHIWSKQFKISGEKLCQLLNFQRLFLQRIIT